MPPNEPPAPDWATTDEIKDSARVKSNTTVYSWAKQGVLPEPTIVERGRKGRMARWPLSAKAQAAWVADALDAGFTLPEVRERLKRGEFKP